MKRVSVNRLLAQALAEVMTLQEVGELLGVSRQRIHQIARKRQTKFPRGRWASPVDTHLKRRVGEVLGGPDGLTAKQQSTLMGLRCRKNDRRGTGKLQTPWEVARSWILAAAWIEGATVDDLAGFLGYNRNTTGQYMHRLRRYGYPFPRRAPGGKTWLEGPLAGQPVGGTQ